MKHSHRSAQTTYSPPHNVMRLYRALEGQEQNEEEGGRCKKQQQEEA